jgi:hypothetical protein
MAWLIDNKEKVFVASILLSSQLIAITGGRLEISDFTALGVLFLWSLSIFTDKEYKIMLSPWHILFLLFLLSVLLSVFNGGRDSIPRLPAVFKEITIFFIIVNIIRNREIAFFSLKIFFSVITFSAIMGIFQEILFFFWGIEFVGYVPEDMRRYMWEPTSMGVLMRVPALTSWYTILANFLLIGIVVGVNLIFYSVLTGKKERLFLYMAVPLMTIALILTFSHSTMIVLLLAVIVLIVIRWPSLKIHVPILLVIMLLALVSGFITDFVEEPKKYFLTEDVRVRVELLRDGIAGFFNRHTFIGNGIGTGSRYTSNIDHWAVHNNVVLIADELGLFGIFAYGTLFSVFIYRQIISILRLKDRKDKAVSISLLIALIAYMTNLQSQPTYIDFFLFMYLGLTEAVIRTLSHQVPLENNAKSET